MGEPQIERLSIGIPLLDGIIGGGIPRGFFVAITGEPGTGKTVTCIHFIAQGIKENDKCVYITTEESSPSIITQASQFNIDFKRAMEEKRLILIDALMGREEQWSLNSLDVEEMVKKVIEAKKTLGYGRARLVIDSLSAFWLDKPAMARRVSYLIKKVLSKWDFTTLGTSQYAITTSEAFGWGVEHIADGILRFRRLIKQGKLHRYLMVEKMRQTNHSLYMYEIDIVNEKGLVLLGKTSERREDYALPSSVKRKIMEIKEKEEEF
ncbi:MAG: KaiC domain-containing protein [Nitrososphaerales archaeon]